MNLFVNTTTGVNLAVAGILTAGLLFSGCRSEESYSGEHGDLPQTIDFNRDVRGILSESCFSCHGPDAMARTTDWRLDDEESAFLALDEKDDRYAIVPGRPDQSELYKRITSDDPDFRMPAPDSNLPPLGEYEVAVLKRWIEQGAGYKPHWSFIPPVKAERPEVINREWPLTPIDYFTLSRMEERGMNPTREAGKERLLRRVSFDLTGLPPTIDDLDRFLEDDSPGAYEKEVDRLLASDGYGERMAAEWLDAARYADSHGYEDDGANDMWPWKEWVINAFNRNIPFDQFTTWQLAGDLLPDATTEQKLATGFNRLHQQSGEGGIIPEEYRVEYVADRVYTTSTAFLGMTMQCARCHDHKYDPISEVDYYRFFAFFDNIAERGKMMKEGAAGPVLQLPDEETRELITYLEGEMAGKEQSLIALQDNKHGEYLSWLQTPDLVRASLKPAEDDLIGHLSLDDIQGDSAVAVQGDKTAPGRLSGSPGIVDGVHANALEFSNDSSVSLGEDFAVFERSDPFSFSFWINSSGTSSEVPIMGKAGFLRQGYRGYYIRLLEGRLSVRLVHGWPYNALQVQSPDTLPRNEWSHVAVTYDGSSRAGGLRIYVNGHQAESHVIHDNLYKSIALESTPEEKRNRQLSMGPKPFLIADRNTTGEQGHISFEGLKLDDIKIFSSRLSEVQVLGLAGRSDFQNDLLYDHYLLQHDREYRAELDSLRALRAEEGNIRDTLREVMVMQELLNPRPGYVRERGMYDQLGEEVCPGTPGSILGFSDELPQNRLGLAQWILSPENPLTARVIVNRYWKMFFGEGLVDTPDNFGNQGSMPSHPDLLDWLAVTFRESNWDLKALHKQMVMSRTYRQSSETGPEMLEKDPVNRWLARGPRYRLPAEMIRDNALAASGLLVSRIGGPSVFPYQPEGLWEETTSGRYLAEYMQDEGESLYRRSIYTFVKRSSPPPGMTTFDAAPRTHPVVARQRTNTPLQALHTMNDLIYMEASRLLSERMINEGGDSLADQITLAFRAVTSRFPDDREMEVLTGLYNRQLAVFNEDRDRALDMIQVGGFAVDEALKPSEIAAGMVVANTILNLHETLTKQ
ncbi:MAG: DUF1553 domain-containing protein [Balneolales bacterium]